MPDFVTQRVLDEFMKNTTPNPHGTKPKPYFHFIIPDAHQALPNVVVEHRYTCQVLKSERVIDPNLQTRPGDSFNEKPIRVFHVTIEVSKNELGSLFHRGHIFLLMYEYSTRCEYMFLECNSPYVIDSEPNWRDFIITKPQQLGEWLEQLLDIPVFSPPAIDESLEDLEWSVF